MEVIIKENIISIDLENNPHFQWGDTWGAKPLVDWTQLQYQNMYKTNEFIESKFPGHYQHIPGFNIIISKMVERIKTPLEEINERYSIIDEHRNDSDFLELEDSGQTF